VFLPGDNTENNGVKESPVFNQESSSFQPTKRFKAKKYVWRKISAFSHLKKATTATNQKPMRPTGSAY